MLIAKYPTAKPDGVVIYTITTCNEVSEFTFHNGKKRVTFTTYPVGIASSDAAYETHVLLTPKGPTQVVFVENLAGKVVQKFSA